ncbi:helix-turn-helix transcriptional regulator [Cellulomonas composti]|uniref:LuxR family transcriptional regulator n=1 Tax=Cellulomonas composti TaxID=266130 RepID=A0A511JAL3_9CELL|nr:LuxR C-terminal-related transcriptional regulator [Cellulomonas composti]GEL95041.1 LuxR family transcriptional regulator [Cellulomonas composti]
MTPLNRPAAHHGASLPTQGTVEGRPALPTQAGSPWLMPESRRLVVENVRESLEAGRSVLVVGEAGVGKTALAARALERLCARGQGSAPVVVALSGAATRHGIPLAALEPLLGDDGLLAMGSFARTVRALSASLAERASGAPVVLRVDDAHLLDDASAQALAWLVRQGDVLLVATCRQAGAAESPWLELWKDEVVERIDVDPFTAVEMEQWLVAELGGPTTVDTVRRVWGETRGNVFHARELVRSQRAAGAMRESDGVWVWTGRAVPGSRLIEVVENDTARLSPEARRALEVVALLCPTPMSLLLDVVPRTAVDELTHAGVATLRAQPSAAGGNDLVVDLAHALYAEAVRAGISGGRRREVLDAVAGSAHTSSGMPLVRSVVLALDAGLVVGPARLRAAVDAAFELQQPETVVQMVDVVLRVTEPGTLDSAELLLLRAEARWAMSELALAERDARDALAVIGLLLPERPACAEVYVRGVQLVAALVQYGDDDVDGAVTALDEAAATIVHAGAATRWVEELTTARLVRYGFGGRHAETRDEALAVLADPRTPASAVRLVAPTALGLAHAGRFAEARGLCERYLPVARAHGDHYRWAAGEIVTAAFTVVLWAGWLDELEDAAGALDPESPVVLDWVAAQAGRGFVGIARGAWSQAAGDLRAANARLRLSDRGGMWGYTGAAEALANAASGSTALARRQLEQLATTPPRSAAVYDGEVRLLRLDTLAWLRDPGVADEARTLASWARANGYARIELEALHRLVRSGASAVDVGPRVEALAAVVQGPRAAAVAAHVDALGAADPDLARIAERDLNRCGLWLPTTEPAIALTPREREIAALAAGGMTSRAIAARLTLSVRTVDSHLARVFAKTGVHSREDLTAVLR